MHLRDRVVPVLTRHKAAMFAGCHDPGERGHLFLLDSVSVLDNEELGRVTGNFSRLFAAEDGAACSINGKALTSHFLNVDSPNWITHSSLNIQKSRCLAVHS